MEDTSQLIWGMVFGSIGLGYFIYGKKQKSKVALYAGVALMVYPYFLAELYMLVIVGLVLMATPFVLKS